MQADEKAAAEASARKQEEEQREAERRAALKERAESYKAQEASRLQVRAQLVTHSVHAGFPESCPFCGLSPAGCT